MGLQMTETSIVLAFTALAHELIPGLGKLRDLNRSMAFPFGPLDAFLDASNLLFESAGLLIKYFLGK